METSITIKKNKGGRPRKTDKRSEQLAVMCTLSERKQIEEKAVGANLSISEFLRVLALHGKVDNRIKVLPKEVLLFTATLNHLAANINQIAKQANQFGFLNPMEKEEFILLADEIKKLATNIKLYMT